MTTEKNPWRLRFQGSLWTCGLAAFLIHWGVLRGWPLMTGLGVTVSVCALVMLVASSIGLFGDSFMDAWNDEGPNPQ